MENKLLAAFIASRDAWNYGEKAEIENTLSDKSQIIYKKVSEFYKKDKNVSSVDIDILRDRLEREFPKHKDMFNAILSSLPEESPTNNVIQEILFLKKRKVKDELTVEFSQENNDNKIEILLEEYEKYQAMQDELEDNKIPGEIFVGPQIGELGEGELNGTPIRLFPRELNGICGEGVRRKHHVLIYARPDAGKTTFAINLIAGFLAQNYKVLYLSNEDAPRDLIERFWSRMTLMTYEEMKADPDKANALLKKRNWDKFVFKEMTPGTPAEIRALVEEHTPDIVLLDQARNVEVGVDNRVLGLEKVEQFMRNLGKQHNMLTISFTQAGESGHNKEVLEMTDVDWSNTGMQSAADLMLGIGVSPRLMETGHRIVVATKNKMRGGHKEPVRLTINHTFNKVS